MIELRRILLVDWYLFRVEQIDLAGLSALIGPNGAGKSAIIDAAQTVLTGANMHSIRFNPSAQSATRSKRSIRDYCLGVVSLDEKGERSEPTRRHAYTYAILGFVDVEADEAINLGVAFSASADRGDENCEARFMVRGGLIAKEDLLERVGDGEVETRQWHAVRAQFRARDFEVEDGFGSAGEFIAEGLRALSPSGFPLDPRRFIKAFRNALLLKPVDNPTEFVRNYVLDVPTIQVDRLRRSIDLYRYLTGRIEDLKAQTASLGQIQRIVARVQENERVIALTQWQIARLRWEKFRREVRALQGELARLRGDVGAAHRLVAAAEAKLSRISADCTSLELTLKTSDAEQLASMYEADRAQAVAKRENALGPVKRLNSLVRSIEALTGRRVIAGWDDVLHGLLSAIVLAHKPVELAQWNVELPEGWEESACALDQAFAVVGSEQLSPVQTLAADALFAGQKEVHDIQERIDQIDRNLKRLDQGLSAIEPGTAALLNALAAVGISAEPLCDIVDVRDQNWRLAAEAALGRSREALIVEPEHANRALDVYRRGSEEEFRGAEVVNTTKTDKTRPAEKDSLASIITADNRHARAFLDYRLGRLMMVESVERLLAAENAITADRMMNSGRTVKRLRHPGYLKLGRGTVEETRRVLREERAELEQQLGAKARTVQRLNEDSRLIDEVVRGYDEMEADGWNCAELGQTLAEFDRRIAELAASVEEAKRSRDPKLVEQLERAKAELEAARRAKSAADRAWQQAHAAENRVEGNYDKLIKDDHARLRTERRMRAQRLKHDQDTSAEVAKYQEQVRTLGLDRIEVDINSFDADVQRRMNDRRQTLQRELSSALFKHCQQFMTSVPFSDTDAGAEVVGSWAASAKERLETHELVQYEEQCRNAAGEMTSVFRDDLLHRLHDAFEGIRETLAELNRHLKDRVFHSRDYYSFRSSASATHSDLIDLVRESRRPEFQLPLFAEQNKDQPDTSVLRAVRLIESILGNPEAKTDEIEDPRKYFNFELYIQDADGKIRSSLSSRAGTGSGGEGQLPFYIAIGASLAATYQNRRTGEAGLALAIFDEAFNRLDTKAICACCDFMKALGLQVVLATPDEKRHIFMEVADTVVNVNRSGNDVLVDTEYLTEKTRQTLADADPYRKGFDTFKQELIAASQSTREKEIDAAEAAE